MKVGAANALNGIGVVFSSLPGRTTPPSQAVLGNFAIPMTMLFRWLLLHKTPNNRQLIGAVLVVLGLFIVVFPQIFNMEQKTYQTADGVMKYIWPLIFLLAWVPYSLMNVWAE